MGHEVTAFSRSADRVETRSPRLRFVNGDAMSPADIERAVEGQDAVVVTLGITENPFTVRFFGPARTHRDVRSVGTRHVIAAMRKHGVRRLVVQTSYGVGDTRDRLGFLDSLFFKVVLAPQIADTERQNQDVASSELDWVIVQPVHLTDETAEDLPFASIDGEIHVNKISRDSVGRFLAQAVDSAAFVRKSVALSGARA
jgi:uncharacterized protein YbjT (DUF2867 family)